MGSKKLMISKLKVELENNPEALDRLRKSGIFGSEEISKTTLHRWIQGRNCPPLYKQLKMAFIFLSDYRSILTDESIDAFTGGKEVSKVLGDYFKAIDDSNLLGGYSRIRGEISCIKRTVSCADYHSDYQNFLLKMPSYMKLRQHQLDSGLKLDFDVDLIEVFDGETLVGHLAYTKTKEKYLKKINLPLSFNGSLFIFPMWYSSSEILKKLLCQFYLDDSVSKYIFENKKILMMVTNYRTLNFLERSFGGVVESFYHGVGSSSTMYVVSLDPITVISTVDMLKEIRNEYIGQKL